MLPKPEIETFNTLINNQQISLTVRGTDNIKAFRTLKNRDFGLKLGLEGQNIVWLTPTDRILRNADKIPYGPGTSALLLAAMADNLDVA
jgi:hypothetical protein